MSTYRLAIGAMAFFTAVMVPRTGSADIIDAIWKVSGPNLFTPPFLSAEIRIALDGPSQKGVTISDILPKPSSERIGTSLAALSQGKDQPKSTRSWLVVDGKFYISSGLKPRETVDYAFDEVKMVAVDAMYQYVWSRRVLGMPAYTGAGVAVETFFGNFPTFTKTPLKFRLVSVTIKDCLDVGFNLRYYPSRPTAAEFGKIVSPADGDSPELAVGFNIGIAWLRK